MEITKFSKNLTVSYFSEKMTALQQELILLLRYGLNPESILVQGSYESERYSESIFGEPNRMHVRKSLEERKRSQHGIVSI